MIKELLFGLSDQSIFIAVATLVLGEIGYYIWISKCDCSKEKGFLKDGIWFLHKIASFFIAFFASIMSIQLFKYKEYALAILVIVAFFVVNYCIARMVHNKRRKEIKNKPFRKKRK